jgi:hypothetical protein
LLSSVIPQGFFQDLILRSRLRITSGTPFNPLNCVTWSFTSPVPFRFLPQKFLHPLARPREIVNLHQDSQELDCANDVLGRRMEVEKLLASIGRWG